VFRTVLVVVLSCCLVGVSSGLVTKFVVLVLGVGLGFFIWGCGEFFLCALVCGSFCVCCGNVLSGARVHHVTMREWRLLGPDRGDGWVGLKREAHCTIGEDDDMILGRRGSIPFLLIRRKSGLCRRLPGRKPARAGSDAI